MLDLLKSSTTNVAASLAYDYSRIPDAADREALRSAALEIKPRLKRVVGDIVETGQQLLAVRGRCPHGQWGEWLSVEFDLSETMARNWMNSAERFGGKSANFADLPLSALYQLAAPSTPPAAVQIVEERLAEGERVTLAEVQAVVAAHKPAPARSTPAPITPAVSAPPPPPAATRQEQARPGCPVAYEAALAAYRALVAPEIFDSLASDPTETRAAWEIAVWALKRLGDLTAPG